MTPPDRPRCLSPDRIAAISAVVIGVCAFGVSLYQAAIMREQSRMMREEQRASVGPHVALEDSFTGDSSPSGWSTPA